MSSDTLSDTEILDRLERYVAREPLYLWNGDGAIPCKGTHGGLSLLSGRRTLRAALETLLAKENGDE